MGFNLLLEPEKHPNTMCGIVGYIGHRDAYPIIMKGLQRLEYRGYDSAGVALFDGTKINLSKTKGKVEDLNGKAQSEISLSGNIGIGHTRWATHGVPNDVNSHPHYSNSGDLVIIHNGIIENYDAIRKELIKRGYVFHSETDTEVLVNLIEEVKKKEKVKLGKAVQIALNQVVGAYAIAVFDRNKPDEIAVARLGSPLAIGVGEDEFFIASDASPFIEFTNKSVYLEDGEMAIVRLGKEIRLRKIKDDAVAYPMIQELQLNLEEIEKNGYDHFMLKEIYEQPRAIKDTFRGRLLADQGLIKMSGIHENLERFLNAGRIISSEKSVWKYFVLGSLFGFLPCGLSYSAFAAAAATGSMYSGFLSALFFGLGTVPVLFAFGMASAYMGKQLRGALYKAAGILVAAAGIYFIIKGVRLYAGM